VRVALHNHSRVFSHSIYKVSSALFERTKDQKIKWAEALGKKIQFHLTPP
jgi:hypothetical protein